MSETRAETGKPREEETCEDRAQLRDEIAEEKFEKKFEELDSDEKMAVGGNIGGRRGGERRKEQMGGDDPEKAGVVIVHESYSEMGKMGAKKGGYSTGYAHDPEKQREHGVDPESPEQLGAVASADRGGGGGAAGTAAGGREPDVV
ncbi:hypothetical protein Rsub_08624 [Raphidocelis subcapitata]|uniref:Uncharacterized protein n=1 Tax=Raphidocelis subcapitata TaxID=307507 RepID=A0A2V0P9L7_9CHLO|nr:hypothetical protein Rsub_08624 [Raphidocelis subcapitata]|eukprot:GBF95642.1 hypothetical protein Rsub_08624 [Raphidocelis subcapitata]